ncbi:MAG: sulfotransferase [Cyanobacteria bacterium P01_G01_bin.38]
MKTSILVTGAHRSGTTWVGQMIAQSSKVHYIQEPFNIDNPPGKGICGAKFNHWYTQITPEDENLYYKPLKKTISLSYDLLGQLLDRTSRKNLRRVLSEYKQFSCSKFSNKIALLKDPLALFSAEWLFEKFKTKNIVLIRHPAAFASSLKRQGWDFDFSHFTSQCHLLNHPSFPFREDVHGYAQGPRKNIVEQSILLWKVIHARILYYRQKHPDWLFVRHEDISTQPIEGYAKIFKYLGLEFSAAIQDTVADYSSSKNSVEAMDGATHTLRRNSRANVKTWQTRLSEAEVCSIYDGVKEISSHFYVESDWA